MMLKRISAADPTPIRVVIVTLDNHLSSTVDRAAQRLRQELPGLSLTLHAASDWADDPASLERAKADVLAGDIVLATMLFMEDHIQAILPVLEARRANCDAIVGALAAGEVVRLTRIGRFAMRGGDSGIMALLKRLRGGRQKTGAGAGAQQMAMLRRLPRILRFIPGPAQDLRAYFLTLQYWLAGSDDNVANLVRFLVSRYADGPRKGLRDAVKVASPIEYPETGLYHPRLAGRTTERLDQLPAGPAGSRGRVGLLLMRSYVLAGNTKHYDGVIAALEERGLTVVPAFAGGLDMRPAVDAFFRAPAVDAVVSLTGFSLVGGPAYNDSAAAKDLLTSLDVPYLAAHAVEFQTLEQWEASDRGLMPVEATLMVAIPELDGATGPTLFGGRAEGGAGEEARDMRPHLERTRMLAARVAKLVALRKTPRQDRKVGIVLFNFPPNGGATGTAAFLSVFASLWRTLKGMQEAGYRVDLPETVDALRARILGGNASRFGTDANVAARIPVDDHVRRERHLAEIEAQWGPAPGRALSDGAAIQVLGEHFGNVFVGIQPGFGYEGDPMRLLFEKSFAPTHAFSAFYRWLREDFGAHACLHFGTHGALEFMPGKQVGLSAACWPDRLIGDLPNIYLYAANNPSEGAIAKRRAAATLVSYMTPPVVQAGLYRGLLDLKASLERWRALPPEAGEHGALAELIQAQAAAVDLAAAEPAFGEDAPQRIAALTDAVLELEYSLIPHGLHEVGAVPPVAERADLLASMAEASHGLRPAPDALTALAEGRGAGPALALSGLADSEETRALFDSLATAAGHMATDHELPALIRALDGRFIAPVAGGDLLRSPAILPTGRNVHGFDPFRIPSAFAVADGARQAERLLERHFAETGGIPESVALVLWGTDNLKSEGGPIAQALALLGAKPRFDGYGRLCGAALIPLADLGRPRIDVLATLSGIFRDLLPLQTKLLAEAALLAASVDEPVELNFVRKHALAHQAEHGCDIETAALRVFSNADGSYGSNVNQLIDSGAWDHEDELAEAFSKRKCFAYGVTGKPVQQPALLQSMLGTVDLAYQNLESVELGVTTIDHYFDSLGGISRAVTRARGRSVALPVYIGDQTRGAGTVRTLGEQVALETRTRSLNPKWYDGMLAHGYEGVRQIEAQITNTMGWSATTGQVAPWVYQKLTQTFVLDKGMREKLAELNPKASARVVNRLIEAHERRYWTPDEETLAALKGAGEELEDRLEGIGLEGVAA